MEFDYLKAGDKCWVWYADKNTCEAATVGDVTYGAIWLIGGAKHRKDTGVSTTGLSRLVHAPFKAEFPPKPKRKVKKEAWVWSGYICTQNKDGVYGYVPMTYEAEE